MRRPFAKRRLFKKDAINNLKRLPQPSQPGFPTQTTEGRPRPKIAATNHLHGHAPANSVPTASQNHRLTPATSAPLKTLK
jgi:hypothetical protein